VQISIGM